MAKSKELDTLITMKEVIVTITSKNQITLPAAHVRQMKLHKSRRLSVRQRGSELVLIPEPTLKERMQKLWEDLPQFKGTKTDGELNQAIRESMAGKKV